MDKGLKNNRIRMYLCLCLSILILLTACQMSEDLVISIAGEPAYTKEMLKTDASFIARTLNKGKDNLDQMESEERENFLKELVSMRTYEELVGLDKDMNFDSKSEAQALWVKALESFGDEQSLISQLNNYGLSRDDFLESIRRQASCKGHRKAFEITNAPSDDEVEKFYNKNKKRLTLVSFIQVTVPTRSEAVDITKKVEEDPDSIYEYETIVNNDLFDKSNYYTYEDMSYEDDRLVDKDIFKQEVGSVDYYYYSRGKFFAVVLIMDRKDDYESLRDHVRTVYMDESYLDYLNKIAKKNKIRINKGLVEDLAQNWDEGAGFSEDSDQSK